MAALIQYGGELTIQVHKDVPLAFNNHDFFLSRRNVIEVLAASV